MNLPETYLKEKTVFDALCNQLLFLDPFSGRFRPYVEICDLEFWLIDWDKALSMPLETEYGTHVQLKRWMFLTRTQELVLKVGYSKDRVLPLIDPAIRVLVDRLYDLPVVTTFSCSGHPACDEHDFLFPTLGLRFRDCDFGRKFMSCLENVYKESGLSVSFSGSLTRLQNGYWVVLDWQDCLSYHAELHVGCKPLDISELVRFWRLFGEVVNYFDRKGNFEWDALFFSDHAKETKDTYEYLELYKFLRDTALLRKG